MGVRTEGQQGLEESLLVGWVAGVNSLQEIWAVKSEKTTTPGASGFATMMGSSSSPVTQRPTTAPQSLAQNLAVEMEKFWDTDGFQSKYYQAHVQGELCGRLRGYLESWTGFRERTGTAPGPGPFLSPRPLEPPCRDSARGDPPCPLGTYMLCWRGVLKFNAILKASFY